MQAIDTSRSIAAPASFTISHVVQAADSVNDSFKVIRTIITCANKWIKISDHFLKAIKYTKFISSLYGLFATHKLLCAAATCSKSRNFLVAGRSLWPVINNTKKVFASIVWFATTAKDFGLVSIKAISWTVLLGAADMPFKILSLGASILRVGKLIIIWIELERYLSLVNECRLENRPRNSYIITGYLDRAHLRLEKELKVGAKNQFGSQIQALQKMNSRQETFQHALALSRSEEILRALQVRTEKRLVGQVLSICAKIVDFSAAFFENALPRLLFSLSLLSTIATALKMAKHFYGKYQTPKSALLWPNLRIAPSIRNENVTVACKSA